VWGLSAEIARLSIVGPFDLIGIIHANRPTILTIRSVTSLSLSLVSLIPSFITISLNREETIQLKVDGQ